MKGHPMPDDESDMAPILERVMKMVMELQNGESLALRVTRVPVKGRPRGPLKGQIDPPRIEIFRS